LEFKIYYLAAKKMFSNQYQNPYTQKQGTAYRDAYLNTRITKDTRIEKYHGANEIKKREKSLSEDSEQSLMRK
jgi:hypothetical protein